MVGEVDDDVAVSFGCDDCVGAYGADVPALGKASLSSLNAGRAVESAAMASMCGGS